MRKLAILVAGATLAAGGVMAATAKYDGAYPGQLSLDARAKSSGGVSCGVSEPQPRNPVVESGVLKFVFNKEMTLTGPVADDGSFDAKGDNVAKGKVTVVSHFSLKGKIADGKLTGQIMSDKAECIYNFSGQKKG